MSYGTLCKIYSNCYEMVVVLFEILIYFNIF